MAIFNFASTIDIIEDYADVNQRYKYNVDIFLDEEFEELGDDYFAKSLTNVKNLSDELYVRFDSSVFTTIRGLINGPRELYRGQIYTRGTQMALELNNYFDVPKKVENRIFVSSTYNNLPVRGWLYVPPEGNPSYDVIVLYHGSISSEDASPYDAAERFLNLAIEYNRLNIRDKIIFSVAYPQDVIPSWSTESETLNQQRSQYYFPQINISNFYLGDNLAYAEAALLWVQNQLDSYLSSNGFSSSTDKIYTFGHSQGGALVHKLNTMHTVDGVISNAPGPIDLVTRCTISEQAGDSNLSCAKLKSGFLSVTIEPDKYESISLKNYLTGLKSPTLFTQALDDTTGIEGGVSQVSNMQNIMEVGLSTCMDCAPYTFNYYATGGHEAFVSNTQLKRDILSFIGSGA
jgi:hypothetical protein